jgi:hypothetical protein
MSYNVVCNSLAHEWLLSENQNGVKYNPSACWCSYLPPYTRGAIMFIGQQCNLQQKICKDMSNLEHEIEIVSNTKKLTMIVFAPFVSCMNFPWTITTLTKTSISV